MRRRGVVVGVVAVVLVLAVVAVMNNLWRVQPWADGSTHGRWQVMYTGYGTVKGTDDQVLLEPHAAEAANVTHGALVHTVDSYQDADFAVTVRTEEQLRRNDSPNVWEVGWVQWNLRDNDHFYAVALKPNGWEVSKQDPAYPGAQRFIASGTDRTFPVGEDHRVEVTQDWPRMTVTVDGTELATVTDDDSPYRGGAIGLYTEDARVLFRDFEVTGQG
ncbi:family 16 glycoside hydrolase [Kocuria sp.]|uniref:family 16 glycoside hydrolase n=1 Tax=Kocuria sp. TaxID=1871328 RepID=UPI0026DBC0B3|nr:family 16 glycoside hydrolase [Kocuria sp.]MDO4918355.1 DUF1080 domain-containing protein [Kocuria sp.]